MRFCLLGGISIIGARESSIPLDILVWMGIADDFKLQGIFLKSFHYPEGESCPPFNALLYTFYYWLTLTPSLPMADME